MSKQVTINDSVSVVPSGYITGTSVTASTQHPFSNGYNGASNTSNYARIQLNANNTTTDCYLYYTFNVQGVPSNATITSVSCVARTYINSRVSNATLQLYSNTTAKGSSTSFSNTSANNVTISNTGSWSVSDLSNLRLRIQGRRSNTNQTSYIYFYGSDVTINYTLNTTAYEVTTRSDYTGATISPATQDVMSGDSGSVQITASDLNDIRVEDNGTDVTASLQYIIPSSAQQTFTGIPTSYDGANSTYDSIYTGSTSDGLAPNTSTDRICVYVTQTAYAEGKLTYNFDCSSIPQNATITNVSCVAAAACYSSGQYFDTRTVQLYCGSTAKGNPTTITGNGNTRTDHNITGGTWTRVELDDAKLVVRVVRGNNTTQASFSFWGATLTVTYTLPQTPYYEYTLTNVTADHTVVVMENVIIPPEEDPEKTYYNLTISSINATTDPPRGTTRVESGDTEVITIYPTDPDLTLITDNGVDVSSQLVQHGSPISDPTVATAQGASYGFAYSSSTGYYVSQNAGQASSAAVCRVTFNLPVSCLITFQYINYAEATFDYGIFGYIDTALGTTYTADSNAYKVCSQQSDNTSTPQTLTYEMSSGSHYIDIKFRKDSSQNSNNDNLQWKVLSIEPLEANNYYTYTQSNINQSHSLVFIFGDVTYYFVNSSGNDSECKLYPSGSMVQLSGDTYSLTIVPEDPEGEITVKDNNIDVSSQLEERTITVEKDGVQTTYINYIYKITNINATHNITVSVSSSSPAYIKVNGQYQNGTIFMKENGTWEQVSPDAVFVKTSGSWLTGQTSSNVSRYIYGGILGGGEQ